MIKRNDLLTIRMERLQNRKMAARSQGELTPAQKTALMPVMKAVRGSLGKYNSSPFVLELTRNECLALEYAFEAVVV